MIEKVNSVGLLCYFWLPTLSDTEIAVLSEVGFDVDKRESVNYYVTLDELEDAPLLRKR